MSRRNKDNKTNQVMTLDAFSNPMFRLGWGTQAPLEATEYPLTRLTDNYAKLNSMYRSGGIVQAIVDEVPGDMLREWFTLGGGVDPEKQSKLDALATDTHLAADIKEGLKWGRLYGGAVGVIMIKGQENMLDKPLKLDTVLPDSFSRLWILDRWSGVFPMTLDLVDDAADPDFGLPMYYEIRAGEFDKVLARVHHSRVVRFTGRALPYLEKLAEMYWGESEIEPIYDDIVLYDSIMHNMGNLTFQANVDTLAIKNLEQLFAVGSKEQQARFWNMMQAQSVAKSNFGTRLIDQETQLHTQQYTFTGFNYVTEAAQVNLAAKTHIPVTKLFGRSPAGMNATGESDMQNYYDFIDGLREDQLKPILEKLVPVLCMSAWGEAPDDITIEFPPLWTPTAAELADIAGTKTQAIISAFQSNLITQGSAQAELKKLADSTGMFDSIEDKDIKANKDTMYNDLQQMADPMAGLFGGGFGGEADKDTDQGQNARQNGPGGPTEASKGAPGTAQKKPVQAQDAFDPNQPRDEEGKWTDTGASGHKEAQLAIIKKHNPMHDDYHTGIRSVEDIKTAKEAFDSEDDENFVYPDFTPAMAKKALASGKITVYSSNKIGQGTFVSPSKMCASDYAGGGSVKSMEVSVSDIAWINSDEGVFAKVTTQDSFDPSQPRDRYGRWTKVGSTARVYGEADFSDALAEIRSGTPNSMSEFIDEYGNVSPERLEVHKKIIDDILDGKETSEEPTMTLLGGGPASGKSSVLSVKDNDPGVFVIDPDKIKTMLPGYKEMAMKTNKAAGFYHEESSAVAKQLAKVGYSEGINAVYDGTGDGSIRSVEQKIREAREKGYKVNAKYVTISTEEALRRNQKRYDDAKADYEAGRSKVPPRLPNEAIVRVTHAKVSAIAPQVADMFDSFELWANDRGKGNATLIATGGNGRKITPVPGEEKAVQDFLDKAKEV